MIFYKPKNYWKKIGAIPNNPRLDTQAKLITEHIIPLPYHSVFEIGVGEGRITEPILKEKVIGRYDGIDLTPERIVIAHDKLSKYPQFNISYSTFQDYIPIHKYDLVMAIEVLMHIQPKDIEAVIEKMFSMSENYVITCDYYSKNPPRLARHVFNHDYDKLFSGFNVRRIDLEYEQSLFIIGDKN